MNPSNHRLNVTTQRRALFQFCVRSFLISLVSALLLFAVLSGAEPCQEGAEGGGGDCINPDGVRIVSQDELASKTGQDEGEVWIGIMGEVYDVTAGRDFYGPGAGYSVFAAKDASGTFATSELNEKGLATDLKELTVEQIGSLEAWRQFYRDKDGYPFVGVLDGDFYDSEGNPKELLNHMREVIAIHTESAESK